MIIVDLFVDNHRAGKIHRIVRSSRHAGNKLETGGVMVFNFILQQFSTA